MIVSKHRCVTMAVLTVFMLLVQPVWADFIWNKDGPDDDWSNAANWTSDGSTPKGSAPPATVNEPVVYPTTTSTNGPSTMDDGDHVLTAGLTMGIDRSAVTPLDLNGSRLTVDGDTFSLGSWRSSPTIQNGVLQIGTVANTTLMQVYRRGDGGIETATLTVRLDAVNVSNFHFANSSSSFFNAPSQVLDLSGASISSTTGGAPDNALAIDSELIVGQKSGTTASTGKGTLRLPSSLASLSASDVLIGENLRSSGAVTSPGTADGTIDFGGGASLTVNASGSFILAHGDNAVATLTNLPSELNLTVGSTGSPAVMQIAYNDRTQGDAGDNPTSGGLTSPGGSLDIHLTELRVGQNTQPGGSATGVLDLSAGTLTAFSADDVFIGVGVDADGSVLLPGGDAAASNVTIGSTAAGSTGLLDLSGTLLAVDGSVMIDGPADDQGVLTARIQGESAGLDLADAATLSIGLGGLLDIRFEELSLGPPEEIYFGLRWEGSHLTELLALEDSGALTVTNETDGIVNFLEAGGFTYVSLLPPVPEPATGLLLLLGVPIIMRGGRRRARSHGLRN